MTLDAAIPTLADAVAHLRAGRWAEGGRSCRAVLAVRPDDADALQLLGIAERNLGRPGEAVRLIRRAVALRPAEAAWYVNLGEALREDGDGDGAAVAYRQALSLEPRLAEAHNGLGLVAVAHRDHEGAAQGFADAVACNADLLPAWFNLGTALLALGRAGEALDAFDQVIRREPGAADGHAGRADALAVLRRLDEAAAACADALALDPRLHRARNRLGDILRSQGRLEEAATCQALVLAADPDDLAAGNNLAVARIEQGRIAEGLAQFRDVLARHPDNPVLHGNHCFCLYYDPDTTPEAILAEHRRWNDRHAPPASPPPEPGDESSGRLRIGYVSGDLRAHPVASFLEPVLAARDRNAVQVTCYHTGLIQDAVTDRLRQAADAWVDAAALSPAALAGRVRADGIQVLVNLGGFTAPADLLAFALRPAPVQVLALGCCFSSGLDAMDAVILDPVQAPPGCESLFTERVIRMPHGYVCWQPPEGAPAVSPLPMAAAAAGVVTFGSLNNLSKVSGPTVALWRRVLDAVPGSRLLVKAGALSDPATRAHTAARFADGGIGPERVTFLGLTDQAGNLATYHHIDIALDTQPYSGGVTTLEALWMGVPVVAMPGLAFFGRHAASHLTVVGLDELVAADADGFVAAAAALAGDRQRLAALRAGLRQRVAASPLCDGLGYTQALEARLWGLWDEWRRQARQ
ncbi:MAG: tetratricopeptide repeat protein [Alphaproteobacteria bacterium]